MAWFPLGVTTGSLMASSPIAIDFRSASLWALSLVPLASWYTKFDAMCDSTASQSLSLTAFHIRRSYCSTPVADFHPGFFDSFQIDCECEAETKATITSARILCDFMREV